MRLKPNAILVLAVAIALSQVTCGSGGGSSPSTGGSTTPAPTSAFTFTPSAPTTGQTISFTDSSTGSPAAWSWNFGDGSSATSTQNPTHAYSSAGTFTVGLTATNSGGSSSVSHTVTVVAGSTAPMSAFSYSPTSPITGQAVSFTDASTGSPTAWSWNFGDGSSVSTSQNPTHAFSTAGTFTVTLMATNAAGSNSTSHALTVATVTPPTQAFQGNIVLGAPTDTSVKVSLFSASQSGSLVLQYGTSSGVYDKQTPAAALVAGTPLSIAVDGLTANTRYFYRLGFQSTDGSASAPTQEFVFHTARPAGATFSFTIQADSHLDENSTLSQYQRTLGNVLTDAPDFHVDLGDTFMCEKHSAPLTAVVQMAPDAATVNARYVYERTNFGLATSSVPLFLCNGNHEGEAGWLNDGTAQNIAIWTTQARQNYYVNPLPNSFYSGDTTDEPFVGKRASWYAWTWGDAQFIVLDPFWNTKVQASKDPWGMTLGDRQYQWLQQTLSMSSAKFKFVFIHNLVGGLDGQMRGGVEAAPFYEWGGQNADGSSGFTQQRPTYAQPIHALLVKYGVTAVFHGHDHLYAKQTLDGIIYQEVPQPSATNNASGQSLATTYHYNSGTILSSSGHLRVTVSPTSVTSQYVRSWLPASETATQKNGSVDDTWTAGLPGSPVPAFTFSPAAPQVGQAIQFSDGSSGAPTSWSWAFGDGVTSTVQNPTHTYAASGSYTVTLTVANSTGSAATTRTVNVVSAGTVPGTAFNFAPSAPVQGAAVTFTDTSTGTPIAWAWTFGDGGTSAAQNPTHTYAAAGTFTVSLKATNASGSTSNSQSLTVAASGGGTSFTGNIVLGAPTPSAIKANLFSPDQGGTVSIAYGKASGTYDQQTASATLLPATPLELTLDGLGADTQYYYRLTYQGNPGTEASFHTPRPVGSSFIFCLQGDSHPERVNTQFNASLYTRTLQTAAADKPDFYLTIGDDFSVDQLDPTTITAALVTGRYTLQRPYLGLIGRSAPVFLVNGNHEQAARYLLDGTPNNVAVWAQNARNAHYSQPATDGFYTGNTEVVPFIGLLRNHYAWTWGDALFVTIDPYWGSSICVDDPFYGGAKRSNLWDITHGDEQYQWLKATLEQSKAKYKFVFAHHVLGTGRGGTELAGQYEWGGNNANGTWGFTTNRPAWASPLHQLMVANHVTIFFQGHDHIWVHQQLDGVTYQTLSEPADPNYSLFNADAYLTGDKFPNTGYTRVMVSPTGVKVDYVLTYLPADEGAGKTNGSVAFTYTIPSP